MRHSGLPKHVSRDVDGHASLPFLIARVAESIPVRSLVGEDVDGALLLDGACGDAAAMFGIAEVADHATSYHRPGLHRPKGRLMLSSNVSIFACGTD